MNIAIIGSSGYIGSYLYDLISQQYIVKGYDIKPSTRTDIVIKGGDISEETLRLHDIIIYLGGLSGRKQCCKNPEKVMKENVDDFCSIAEKLTSKQIIIYASSAAILENNVDKIHTETYKIETENLDLYTKSMYQRELCIGDMHNNACTFIGLRFGTVIGISPNQRHDLVHIAMIDSINKDNKIYVQNKDCHRAVLGLTDLGNAILNIISTPNLKHIVEEKNVYNLASFNTTIEEIGNVIAKKTGAEIVLDNEQNDKNKGFCLDSTKFKKTFNFDFQCTNESLVELLYTELQPTKSCRVCNNSTSVIINLGKYCLANNFVETPQEQEAYPLVLTRCNDCSHTQLNYTVQPEIMFSKYQYNSGTSKTLCSYFSWLADDIIKDCKINNGTIFELACNDGSQLDEFKKRGWKTFGMDPAHNIVDIALAKGHSVKVGFWGHETAPIEMEIPDVIVAQNVLAHVPDPVLFLKECVNIMSPKTRLYIQTSQCNMFKNGEFDTIYHEHLSFFTANSMKRAAELSGLTIINARKTPIHGESFLFTMKKKDDSDINCTTLQEYIKDEIDCKYLDKYTSHIFSVRRWMYEQIITLKKEGYGIIAYGAAAKGMTLMNFMNIHQYIEYIVDDARMKQNFYTAGTNILIQSPNVIKNDKRPIAIIILAWNFAQEIIEKIKTFRDDTEKTVLIYPFPKKTIEYI